MRYIAGMETIIIVIIIVKIIITKITTIILDKQKYFSNLQIKTRYQQLKKGSHMEK